MTHSFRFALAAVFMLALSGCDGGGIEEPPPPPPGVTNTTIRLDFNYVEVLNDCDGFPLGEGEFTMRVTATPSFDNGTVIFSSSERGFDDGDRTGALGRREFTTTATNGQQVTVSFRVSEIDYDVFGNNPFADSRMNGITQTGQHTYSGSAWSGLGPRTITVGSGDCRARLSYTVSEV